MLIWGQYGCSAENEVGKSAMVTVATILVEEKPRVTLSVDPATAINEMLNANVTLMCLSDRDERFMAVKWYLDGELLKVRNSKGGAEKFKVGSLL